MAHLWQVTTRAMRARGSRRGTESSSLAEGLVWTVVGELPKVTTFRLVSSADRPNTLQPTHQPEAMCVTSFVSDGQLALCMAADMVSHTTTSNVSARFHSDALVMPPKPFHSHLATLPLVVVGHALDGTLLRHLPASSKRHLVDTRLVLMQDALPDLILQAAEDASATAASSTTLSELMKKLLVGGHGAVATAEVEDEEDEDEEDEGVGREQDSDGESRGDSDGDGNSEDELMDSAAVRKSQRECEILDGLVDDDEEEDEDDVTTSGGGGDDDEEAEGDMRRAHDVDSDDDRDVKERRWGRKRPRQKSRKRRVVSKST